MKTLTIALVMIFSFSALAMIPNNSFGKVDYKEIEIYDVVSVTPHIKFVPKSPTNISYYTGYIVVKMTVEGYQCRIEPNSLGALRYREGQAIVTRLVAGAAWTNQLVGCPQPSMPVTVHVPISIGLVTDQNDQGVTQSLTYIRYAYDQSVANIVMKARGSQIQVSIVKAKTIVNKK